MDSFTKTTDLIKALFSSGKQLHNITRPTALQAYLDNTYKKVKDAGKLGPDLGAKTKIPIAIFLRGKAKVHEYAGKFDKSEFHFSGSLPKVAAMFAAFKLRREARLLIDELKGKPPTVTTPTLFFAKLEPRLNLDNVVPEISSQTGFIKKPLFNQVLNVTGFPGPDTLAANFTDNFATHMRKMIVPSNNCSAGECIRRLSYTYINVKLMEDGFFNKTSMKGIWLCGDYIENTCFNSADKQTFIRLATENDCHEVTHDCGSAQNTTAKPMAEFFLKILLGELVDPDSSTEMRTLLHEGQHGEPPMRERSFLTRRAADFPLLFDVDAVKIGQGPLKPDAARGVTEVRSEGIIIQWKNLSDPAVKKKFDDLNLTGEGAICWQNHSNGMVTDGVAEIINTSVLNYMNQAPIVP